MSLSRAVLPSTVPIRSRVFSALAEPARSSPRPHHLNLRQQQSQSPYRRPYSSSSSSSSSPSNSNSSSQYNRSQFKILPFLTIIGIGSGSYIFLVKSRTGARKPQPDQQS